MEIEKEIKKEVYTNLKAEHQYYFALVQKLWIYKLTTLGAIISIAILNEKIFDFTDAQLGITTASDVINNVDIMVMGLITLPFISFIIDIKVLEIGLHAKGISEHIKKTFANFPEVFLWEVNIWKRGSFLTLRTFLTILNAVGTSITVLVISFYFASILKPEFAICLKVIGLIFIIIPSVFSVLFYFKLTDKKNDRSTIDKKHSADLQSESSSDSGKYVK